METTQPDKSVDVKLIPKYDCSARQSITEWLEKVELLCRLRGIDDVATVIPLRLTGGAFAVYMQLTAEDQKDPAKVKKALTAAFAMDSFVAYEQFVSRKLRADEPPDMFLAELRRLAALFGGVSERALACAFVAGLPGNVRQFLGAGSRTEELSLSQILARARAIIVDDRPTGVQEACLGTAESELRSRSVRLGQRCFSCGDVGHFARECLNPRQNPGSGEKKRPLGFDFILGMNGITALGGVSIDGERRVRFGGVECAVICAATPAGVRLEEKDFAATFDPVARSWTAAWKWSDGEGPAVLKNYVGEYPPGAVRRGRPAGPSALPCRRQGVGETAGCQM
ncbi:zinc knuckle [Trichuris suis]|nr:zinc knuckle [Trichuris suis]